MVTLGSGDYTYEPIENWAQLPAGWSFKEIGGVGVDSKGNLYTGETFEGKRVQKFTRR